MLFLESGPILASGVLESVVVLESVQLLVSFGIWPSFGIWYSFGISSSFGIWSEFWNQGTRFWNLSSFSGFGILSLLAVFGIWRDRFGIRPVLESTLEFWNLPPGFRIYDRVLKSGFEFWNLG